MKEFIVTTEILITERACLTFSINAETEAEAEKLVLAWEGEEINETKYITVERDIMRIIGVKENE